MRNLTKIFVAVAGLFVGFACTTDVTEDLGVNVGGQTTVTLSLEESRTELGAEVNNLYPVTWCADDAISINGVPSSSIAIASNAAVATFSFNASLSYPYEVAYPAAAEGKVLFASQQGYSEGTFANGAAVMYGYAEANGALSLKHLTGVLKIGVTGNKTLAYAQISTVDRAPIAGEFDFDFEKVEVKATSASTEVISYSFGEGLSLSTEASYLHVAVPAGVYNELYVTLYDNEGGVMYATVKANDEKPLAAGKVREFTNTLAYAPNANVYVIRDKASLKGFAEAVAAADSAYTNDVLMVADVDMTGENWESINWKSASLVAGEPVLATFHGNGYSIKGLNAPLFDTLTANVKGLHLRDVNINETVRPDAGSLARWFKAANFAAVPTAATAADIAKPVVSHCSASGKITIECKEFAYDKTRPLSAYGPFSSGGLLAVSLSGDIEDCVSEVDLDIKQIVTASNTTTLYPWVGGIVGYMESVNTSVYIPETMINLRRLTNKGDISYHDPYATFTVSDYSKIKAIVGGVAGANATKAYNCEMVDLKNYGNITISGKVGHDTMVGGVVGRPSTANGKNFYNYGKVSMTSGTARLLYMGGVIGYSPTVERNNYDNIHNYGVVEVKDVEAYALCVGGVVGTSLSNSSYTETNSMTNVSNNAPVTVENYTGQTGHTAGAYFRVGGVSAWMQHPMDNCVNNKEGIVTVKNCAIFNAESALNALCIGGVVGYKTVHTTNNCVNHAEVNVDASTVTTENTMTAAGYVRLSVGGVFGWKTDKTGDKCTNNGNVTVGGTYCGRLCVGGICGSSSTTNSIVWTNLENNGQITIKDNTSVKYASSFGGIFGLTQSGVDGATNNADINIGKFTAHHESHYGGIAGYVAKTTTNFNNLTNKGNLTFSDFNYVGPTYIGGLFGYALENTDKTSYPGTFGLHQYGKINITATRPARSVWKDEYTSGATIAIGGLGGFLGGLLDDATIYEGADCTLNLKSVTNFTPKGGSADKGNVQWGDFAVGMKDYPTNVVNYGNFTFTGTTNGTFYSGMFCAPYNYSRKNCVNYGTQTINATMKTNCFPSHGCYDGNANATFVNCENHGDLVFGPKCNVTSQLRTGMYYAKLETASKTNIIDGCVNTGDIIIQKGAKIGTETRIGTAVGCQNRGVCLIRNGYTNSGNIIFSGACNRKDADKPLCLGGVIGNSSSNGDGDTNTAAYGLAAAATVGAISYPAGSWTGDIVNTGSITYDGTCVTGVCIGGIFGDVVSNHTTYAVPSGAKYIFTGDITATGTFATTLVETDGGAAQDCWNGIGGLYGFTTIAKCVAENAEVYSNINAVGYPSVGMFYGFNRTNTCYVKNGKVGGSICKEKKFNGDTFQDEEVVVTIDESNFMNCIYGTTTDWAGSTTYDGCSFLSVKPTI